MTWTLHPIASFAALQTEWDALQARSTAVPFLSSAFLTPLLATYGNGQERIAVQQGASGWQAAALVRPEGRARWELFQPSQLPLGAWIGTAPQSPGGLDSLLRALPGFTLALGASQLDSRLHAPAPDTDTQRSLSYIDTGWVDVNMPFTAYWEARGKNLRQNTKKARNKLAAEGITARLDCVTTADGMAEALRQYGELESAGWKAGDGTAIHPDNAQGRFYLAMLQAFAAQGCARVYRYWFGDEVVAMDLCISAGRMLVILKTAYDEKHKAVSPSTLMRQEQFEQLFGEGAWDRIEFYGKVMEWHTRWTPLARPIYHRTAYRWPWLRKLKDWRDRRAAAAEPAQAATTPPAPEPEKPAPAPPAAG